MNIAHSAATTYQVLGRQRLVTGASSNSQWSHVIITSLLGWWQRLTVQRLFELLSLPSNWDSYGSRPPTEEAVFRAVELVVLIDRDNFLAPRVVPISGGGVQLVWQSGTRELEIELSPTGLVEYLKAEAGEPLEEGVVEIGDRKLDSLLAWLFV